MVAKLEELSRRDLERLVEMKLMLAESKEEDALARLVETSILLEGKKRPRENAERCRYLLSVA